MISIERSLQISQHAIVHRRAFASFRPDSKAQHVVPRSPTCHEAHNYVAVWHIFYTINLYLNRARFACSRTPYSEIRAKRAFRVQLTHTVLNWQHNAFGEDAGRIPYCHLVGLADATGLTAPLTILELQINMQSMGAYCHHTKCTYCVNSFEFIFKCLRTILYVQYWWNFITIEYVPRRTVGILNLN